MSHGQWHCYHERHESEVLVKDWNGNAKEQRLAVAEMWTDAVGSVTRPLERSVILCSTTL